MPTDRKSTRLNSSHLVISYAVFCLKKKKTKKTIYRLEYTQPTKGTALLDARAQTVHVCLPVSCSVLCVFVVFFFFFFFFFFNEPPPTDTPPLPPPAPLPI